jgi:hypothetical protein
MKMTRRFEHKNQPPLPPSEFRWRFLMYLLKAASLVGFSLGIGVFGYHYLESLPWIDSFLNAAMILGGMGPVNSMQTEAGKIFAALYALYSGIVFIVVAGLLFAPVFHRLLHKFHFDSDREKTSKVVD